jgi:hypothetical protein
MRGFSPPSPAATASDGTDKSGRSWGLWRDRFEGSSSFLKKRTKKLLFDLVRAGVV